MTGQYRFTAAQTREYFLLRRCAAKLGLRLQMAKSSTQVRAAGGKFWLALPGSLEPLESFAELEDAAELLGLF